MASKRLSKEITLHIYIIGSHRTLPITIPPKTKKNKNFYLKKWKRCFIADT